MRISVITLSLLFFSFTLTVHSTTFTFINNCAATVWPGILSGAGSSPLDTTGFELPTGSSHSLQAPTGWSGRFWSRTGCSFDGSSRGSCTTGDCGSGEVSCNGAGAAPPATLAEFTLAGASGKDFYDVSLVDGYNLPMVVESSLQECPTKGCLADLNRQCPAELKVGEGEACRSACEAFGKPEFCCSGEYASPATCRPSIYSEMFKNACPKSYSYAFDDSTSTFTCSGSSDYTITFCPGTSTRSQKAAKDIPSSTPSSTKGATGGEEMMLQNGSWLASLATGDAPMSRMRRFPLLLQQLYFMACSLVVLLLQ